MALRIVPDKTASDAAKDIRRIAAYVLKTNADALNRIVAIKDTYSRNALAAALGGDATEAVTFFNNLKAFVAAHDDTLSIGTF